jgi:hypothetical protein
MDKSGGSTYRVRNCPKSGLYNSSELQGRGVRFPVAIGARGHMISRLLRFTILTACLLTVATRAWAATGHSCSKCYISYSTGNDAYDGTAEVHPSTPAENNIGPWQHAPYMVGCTGNCAAQNPVSTDQYIFMGGDVWPSSTLPWNWNNGNGGTSTPNSGKYPGLYFGYDPNWNNGTVVSVRPTSSGYNCTSIEVTLSGGGGNGATATANFQTTTAWAGLLQHVTVTNPGSGYASNPTVSFAGSNCTVLPTAVADIQAPVFDGSGTTWTTTNLLNGRWMIAFGGLSYATFDHLEFRGMNIDHNIGNGGGEFTMVVMTNMGHVVVNAVYVHNFGIDNFIQTGSTQPTNDIGGLNLNQGYEQVATVQNSFFDNAEKIVKGPCGWLGNNSPGAKNPLCGQALVVSGATTYTNNVIHDGRGLLYDGWGQNQVISGNMVWDGLFDAGSQHGDGLYFHSGGYIYNNVFHDINGGSNYIEVCTANNCTQPNTVYFFNNVFWNQLSIGAGQPFLNMAGEFGSSSTTWASNPQIYIFNNSGLANAGTGACFGAGQFFNAPGSLWAKANFTLHNNLCTSDQSGGGHWYGMNNSGTCTASAYPNGCGTWNGQEGPNAAATKSAVDGANLTVTQAVAKANNLNAATKFQASGSNALPVFAGTNLTTSTNGLPGCDTPGLSALCKDILGNPRPSTGPWKAGAYVSGQAAGPTAPLALAAQPH